jgi:hypothetical protein
MRLAYRAARLCRARKSTPRESSVARVAPPLRLRLRLRMAARGRVVREPWRIQVALSVSQALVASRARGGGATRRDALRTQAACAIRLAQPPVLARVPMERDIRTAKQMTRLATPRVDLAGSRERLATALAAATATTATRIVTPRMQQARSPARRVAHPAPQSAGMLDGVAMRDRRNVLATRADMAAASPRPRALQPAAPAFPAAVRGRIAARAARPLARVAPEIPREIPMIRRVTKSPATQALPYRARTRPASPGTPRETPDADARTQAIELVWARQHASSGATERAAAAASEREREDGVRRAVDGAAHRGQTDELLSRACDAMRREVLAGATAERLADDLLRRIDKRLRIERERRGL